MYLKILQINKTIIYRVKCEWLTLLLLISTQFLC